MKSILLTNPRCVFCIFTAWSYTVHFSVSWIRTHQLKTDLMLCGSCVYPKGSICVAPNLSQPSAAGWGCAQCSGTEASPPPSPSLHCPITAPEMPPGIILGHESPCDVSNTFLLTESRLQGKKGEGRHCGAQGRGSQERMEAKGAGLGGLCLAVLCVGVGE